MFNKNIESYGNKEEEEEEEEIKFILLYVGLPLLLLILCYVFLFMTGNNLIAHGGLVTIGIFTICSVIIETIIFSDEKN